MKPPALCARREAAGERGRSVLVPALAAAFAAILAPWTSARAQAPAAPAAPNPPAIGAPAAPATPAAPAVAAAAPAKPAPKGPTEPGSPDFVGPLQPSGPTEPGSPDFVGPIEPYVPKPGDDDFVGALLPRAPKPGEAEFVGPLVNPDRITFDLKVPPEKGGGAISGSADVLESLSEDEMVAEGNVEVKYKDTKIRAEQVEFHRMMGQVVATGNVVAEQGPQTLQGERGDFNLDDGTGEVFDGWAALGADMYVRGKRIAKIGEDVYDVEQGVFTSCVGERPGWSFKIRKARINVGGYAHLHGVTMKVEGLPVLYWPALLWPAKVDRSSGLLVPRIGYSKTRGGYLGLADFLALGPSYDATFYFDAYTSRFFGLGQEFRYAPVEDTKGMEQVYFLRDPTDHRTQWKWRLSHDTEKLFGSLKAVVDWEDYSDFAFFRNFLRGEFDNSRPYIYSDAFVSGGFGPQSFTLTLDQRKNYLPPDLVYNGAQRKLPELAYRVSKLKLWNTPVYFSFDSRFSELETSSVGTLNFHERYGRVDLKPQLTVPVPMPPWLSLSATVGEDLAWYQKSVPTYATDPLTNRLTAYCGKTPVDAATLFCDQRLTRSVPTGEIDLVGPSFSRIFDTSLGQFSKFKHVIEPRVTYFYFGKYDAHAAVPIFDEVDTVAATNGVEYSLANRVLAKPIDESQGGAFEIASFTLTQDYSLDKTQPLQTAADGKTSQQGPLRGNLRFNLSRDFSLQATASYSTFLKTLSSTSLGSNFDFKHEQFGLSWYTNRNPLTRKITGNALGPKIGFDLFDKRLAFYAVAAYEVHQKMLQQQQYFVTWTGQCWGLTLEVHQFNNTSYRDQYYALSISLKNVGDFIDVTGGSRTYF